MLLVGYQASGTLGRLLEDGASTVRIQGDEIVVRDSIRKLDVYSGHGHADGPELAAWIAAPARERQGQGDDRNREAGAHQRHLRPHAQG